MDILRYFRENKIDVIDEKAQILPYVRDASYFKGSFPMGVALPKDENEISLILSKCNEENVKVITRGGGTSLTGSSVSIENSLVISTLRLNRILEFSGGDRYVHAQSGVRIDDLNSYLQSKGFLYPPDPASSLAATVGGTISTNAGGLRGTYFGSTKEWVLGLGVVLPDGKIIKTGGKVLKRSIGYDLTALFIGSEGTLGVIYDAFLKVVPSIYNYVRILSFFNNSSDLGKAIFNIKERGINPISAEFADKISLGIMAKIANIKVPNDSNYLLMSDIPAADESNVKSAIEIIKETGALESRIMGKEESDAIYKARKGLYSSLLNERENKDEYIIIGDIVVPSSKVPDALHDTEELAKKIGLKTALFGHIGDGNIHANVFTNLASKESMDKAREFLISFGEIALSYGGSVSAEHGIGYEKKDLLIMEFQKKRSMENLEIMKSIKKIFDPKNIMNPGKVFDL